jgi:hypothetical protein
MVASILNEKPVAYAGLNLNLKKNKPDQLENTLRLKIKWEQMALAKIAAAEKIKSVEKKALARNKVINQAYAEMYLSNPAVFKWAGMAAFASHSAGEKMKLIKQIGHISTFPARVAWDLIALPGQLSDWNCRYMFAQVAQGNKAIYCDLYWQHLAYRAGGIAELSRIYQQGDLPEAIWQAWQQIDWGRRTANEELIWEGNLGLLMHEQKYVIQAVLYQGWFNRSIWKMISLAHQLLGILLDSPVPGGAAAFREAVPNGNLADVDQRWHWCVEHIVPAWRNIEQTNFAGVEKQLKGF